MKIPSDCKPEIICSQDPARAGLSQVSIQKLTHPFLGTDPAGNPLTKDYACATDGHRAVFIPVEMEDGDQYGMIAPDILELARKESSTSSSLLFNLEKESVTAHCCGTEIKVKRDSLAYPNIAQVIPNVKREVKHVVAMDLQLLSEMIEAMGCAQVKLTFGDAVDVILVEDITNRGRFGVLMPCRLS